jgi:site-specific DNA-adenine methylase
MRPFTLHLVARGFSVDTARVPEGGTMDFYCDYCGFHTRFGLGMAPVYPRPCHVCGLGMMIPGEDEKGFWIEQKALYSFGVPRPPLTVRTTSGSKPIHQLDYFANEAGDKYKQLIQTETVYLGTFNNYLLPSTEQFAWLTPYTGNKHNQRFFTQAALARVAIAQFQANGGVFPKLIEPFVGSGQVFLNACCWGPAFNQGIPLFHEFIGGDLNPYVVATYQCLRDQRTKFIDGYRRFAKLWDTDVTASFKERKAWLAEHGGTEATGTVMYGRAFAAMSYIYVVNRCVHGSKLTAGNGVQASMRTGLNNAKLKAIRGHEYETLTAVLDMVGKLGATTFACQDFEVTCDLAEPTDVVFMDCPFPNFTKAIPKPGAKNPESTSVTANTYGVGDDGAELQTRIVNVTRKLINQGTTVILCNFANPGLIRAYSDMLWGDTGIPQKFRRWFTYTYCSPARTSEAYLLTILPGRGKLQVNDVPNYLHVMWQRCAADDDNFGEPEEQQYFWDVKVAKAELPVRKDWDAIKTDVKQDKATVQPDERPVKVAKRKLNESDDEQPDEWVEKDTAAKRHKVEIRIVTPSPITAAQSGHVGNAENSEEFEDHPAVVLLDQNELDALDQEDYPFEQVDEFGFAVEDQLPANTNVVETTPKQ